MVLVNQVKEPFQEMVTFFLRYAVDVPHVASHWENALPASHRIRANDGMDCLELGSDVFWGAAGLIIEFEPSFLGDFLEERLGECAGQSLEELLIWLADAIIDLIARCPQGVCSY